MSAPEGSTGVARAAARQTKADGRRKTRLEVWAAHPPAVQAAVQEKATKGRAGATETAPKPKRAPQKKAASPLPRLPRVRPPRPRRACECGCGGETQARFVPGHDSRLHGLVLRVERAVMTAADVERLFGKDTRAAVEKAIEKRKGEAK